MRQDQLDGLVTFLSVAESASFSGAAVRLGISPSAVSQSIRALEQRLGLPLFNRTTRSVHLTEAGQHYLDRVRPAVQELASATEELGDRPERPAGLLRLNVPRTAFLIVLQPIMRRFLDAYPEIDVEITVENSFVDIIGAGFDAGMRFGDRIERDMVAVKVGPPLEDHVIASPDYLGRRGLPTEPRQLLDHDCILLRRMRSGLVDRWHFAKDGEEIELAVKGRFISNDASTLIQATLDGLGIAYTINGYIERFLDEGRLVRLLSDWSRPTAGLSLYFPDRKRVPAKLRALIEFLRKEHIEAKEAAETVAV